MKEEAQVSSVFTQPWSRGRPEKSLHPEPTLLSKAVLLKRGFSVLILLPGALIAPSSMDQ